MSSRAVEADTSPLVAIGREDRPLGLVPPAFEVVGDLGKRGGEEGKSDKSDLEKHGR